jgi:spermidine synthase
VYVPLSANAGPLARVIVRVVCCALVLLPPTCLMGATLPLILRSSIAGSAAIGPRIGLLYGINTAGAIAGALFAGYVLVGSAGIAGAFRVAAAINLIVGVAAIALDSRLRPPHAVPERLNRDPDAAQSASEPGTRGVGVQLIPVAFAVSGMTSLALEVIWFRTLVLYFPATTYAFTAMLASVLGGIAAGSLIVAPVLRRSDLSLSWFGVLHAGIGAAAVAGFVLLGAQYQAAWAGQGVTTGAALAILPSAVLMGAAFPVGIRLWVRAEQTAGRRLGLLYGLNLLGAIAGSMLAGFVLLPRFGSARSLAIVAGINVVLGVVLTARAARRTSLVAAVFTVMLAGGYAIALSDLPDPFVAGLMKRYRDAGRVFFKHEGVQTTVSVHVRELGGRQLYLDGLHQASDGRDVVRLHRQIGHLPVLVHPAPGRALVIGLGGGATAGAVSLHPHLQVDIVELAPGVIEAAQWFTHINEDVLRRPNVQVKVDDARNYLLVGRARYDVITADIIQPNHAGAGLLYSREYFELARRALNDGGVMVQWVGPRSELEYKLIARTFQSVFPETTVWANGSLLIGSIQPLAIDRRALAARFGVPTLQPSLDAAGFPDVDTLLGQYAAGPRELRAFLGDGPLLTDDKPMLEYYLSLPRDQRPVDLGALRSRRN